MKTLIVIPARYGSTRFPGKPLKLIAGRSMIERTALSAQSACAAMNNATYVVATDDKRIETHCRDKNIPVIMTPSDLPTGSDRALFAAEHFGARENVTFDYILNLQGDAPFTPREHLLAVYEGLKTGCDVATPFIHLSWAALDTLRAHKTDTPFSGTSVIVAPDGRALWFSKNILPAIRREADLRARTPLSPVKRHVGLYGYRHAALKRFTQIPVSHYEALEGLEQLRLLENGFNVRAVEVLPPQVSMPGIDTEQDLNLAERLIAEHGDPHA